MRTRKPLESEGCMKTGISFDHVFTVEFDNPPESTIFIAGAPVKVKYEGGISVKHPSASGAR